jgi:predicted metal-dependent hydrolase
MVPRPEVVVRKSSRARRMRIVVRPDSVELVLPRGVRKAEADAFLKSKDRWIAKTHLRLNQQSQAMVRQAFTDGAPFQLRGESWTLRVVWGDVEKQVADPDSRTLTLGFSCMTEPNEDAVRLALKTWLSERALADIVGFGAVHEDRLGTRAASYRLTNAKTRWGSCSPTNVVRVHWRLVQAPPAVLEYVVAHELAHLIRRNHSPAFWRTLANTLPDVATRCTELRRWEQSHPRW